jgi:hypothetical protein
MYVPLNRTSRAAGMLIFSGVRWALLETRRKDEITPSTRVSCSSVAGGLSAAITGTVMRKLQ